MQAMQAMRVIKLPYDVVESTAVSGLFRCNGNKGEAIYDISVGAIYYQPECVVTRPRLYEYVIDDKRFSIRVLGSVMRLISNGRAVANTTVPMHSTWEQYVCIADCTHNGDITHITGICLEYILEISINWTAVDS